MTKVDDCKVFQNSLKINSEQSNFTSYEKILNIKNEENNYIYDNIDKENNKLKSPLIINECKKYEFRYFYPITLTINACLCSFFVGYNLGVFDTMQSNLTQLFGWDDEIKDIYVSIISSSVLLGACLGSLTSGYVLRIYGRRYSFFIYNILSIMGMIMSVILNVYIIISGRVLVGISAGAFSSLIPIYVNEFVPYAISGACGVSIEMAYALGICISYVFGLGLPEPEKQTEDNRFWCVMFLFPICLIAINQIMLICYYKYDSPKYLVLKKKKDLAVQALREIYINESDINYLIENIQNLEECSSDGSVTFKHLLSKSYRKRFFIGVCACWGQQSNGIDTFIFH